jgi:hypothetical protein
MKGKPVRRIVLTIAATLAILSAGAGAVTAQSHQVVVCKYVGTPGVNERLQTGQNPVVADKNTLKGFKGTFPFSFPDRQGRSIAIRVAANAHDGNLSECPGGSEPSASTVTPSPSVQPTSSVEPSVTPSTEPTPSEAATPSPSPAPVVSDTPSLAPSAPTGTATPSLTVIDVLLTPPPAACPPVPDCEGTVPPATDTAVTTPSPASYLFYGLAAIFAVATLLGLRHPAKRK